MSFDITKVKKALLFSAKLRLATALLVKSGETGDYSDSSIERTPDGRLHVNGYVWSSLVRRALSRLEKGAGLSKMIGKFHRVAGEDGNAMQSVSPAWFKPAFSEFPIEGKTVIVPGIRISREYGAVVTGGLYSDEAVLPGLTLPLTLTFLCGPEDDGKKIRDLLAEALSVVNDGIETIGGGWGYGYGRLEVVDGIRYAELDLKKADHRAALWTHGLSDEKWEKHSLPKIGDLKIRKPWTRISATFGIEEGQLFAIHTNVPPARKTRYTKDPDKFVYTRPRLGAGGSFECGDGGLPVSVPVVTGKAIRQGVFSREIERALRSAGEKICLDTTLAKVKTERGIEKTPRKGEQGGNGRPCTCKKCLWFGDTSKAGIVSVTDSEVRNQAPDAIHRIQLCEHSMQNNNLFSSEYLTAGEFDLRILIDLSDETCSPGVLQQKILTILSEMKRPDPKVGRPTAPKGWYRLGATTSCAGQMVVLDEPVIEKRGET